MVPLVDSGRIPPPPAAGPGGCNAAGGPSGGNVTGTGSNGCGAASTSCVDSTVNGYVPSTGFVPVSLPPMNTPPPPLWGGKSVYGNPQESRLF